MDAATSNNTKFNIAPGLKSEAFRAGEIGVHRITLARARNAGDLAFVRVGDRVFYDSSHIIAWLERHERPARDGKAA